MVESFWKSEVVAEAEPERPAAEPAGEAATEAKAESSAAALSMEDFSALEERILRAVNLVKWERQARATAEERASAAEAQLREQAPLAESLQREVSSLRGERDQIRQRVERLLAQLDALEMSGAAWLRNPAGQSPTSPLKFTTRPIISPARTRSRFAAWLNWWTRGCAPWRRRDGPWTRCAWPCWPR